MKDINTLYKHGGLWAGYNSLTQLLIIPYVLALGASNTQVGLVAAMPYIAMFIMQIPATWAIAYFRRQFLCAFVGIVSRGMWFFIPLVPYIFTSRPVEGIILIFFIMRCFESFTDAVITSIIGDVVPVKKRGIILGIRFKLQELITGVCLILSGFWLDIISNGEYTFLIIFWIGAIFGIFCSFTILRLKLPRYKDKIIHHIKEIFSMQGAFRKYVIYMMFFDFAFMFSSPLTSAYLLRDLEIGYIFYVLAISLVSLTKIFMFPFFGKLSDQVGEKPVAIIGIFGTAIIPLTYLMLTKNTIWLVIPIQILAGCAWAAVRLTMLNMLLDYSTRNTRIMQVATNQMYTSISLGIAPILGGLVADNVRWIISGVPLVFAIGFFLRISSLFFLYFLPETRIKKKHGIKDLFWVIMHGPLHKHRKHF